MSSPATPAPARPFQVPPSMAASGTNQGGAPSSKDGPKSYDEGKPNMTLNIEKKELNDEKDSCRLVLIVRH